jgi:NADP-dependent 3-hydroxy acid dehydrogenase YdfG
MPTIAIVGAGPGLGLAVAEEFGSRGFDAALIARDPDNLAALVAKLEAAGVSAAGFAADVADRPALEAALGEAAERFGAIDVLEYSPFSGAPMADPLTTTVDKLRPMVEQILYGGVTAAGAVLPAMLERGAGSLLFTGGIGSINPYPFLAEINTAQAALRNWVLNLNGALAEKGIFAGHVAIGVMIGEEAPPGVPHAPAAEIAKLYWEMHEGRDEAERTFTTQPSG